MFGERDGTGLTDTSWFGGRLMTALLALLGFLAVPAMAQAGDSVPTGIMQGVPWIWLVAPICSVIGLGFALHFYRQAMEVGEGTDMMRKIAQHIREGADAYLHRQYRVVTYVFAILFVLFLVLALLGVQNPFMPAAFLAGGFFSGLCGYLGMKTATSASARTANEARESLDGALKVSFRSGSVMGLTVVGFGLLNVAIWYAAMIMLYTWNVGGVSTDVAVTQGIIESAQGWNSGLLDDPQFVGAMLREVTSTMLTFGIGASTMALFARVGGGIYTKTADVGADLVGKVEAGIAEDDPRNPGTIADNVGDNVGDVAGMGADLYESYVGSLLATCALGAAIPAAWSGGAGWVDAAWLQTFVVAPMVVAGIGILLSVLGIYLVRCEEGASQENLLRALMTGTFTSTALIAVVLAILAAVGYLTWGVFGAVTAGLIAGVIIGQATEWFTSDAYHWTTGVAEQAEMGTAPIIIEGVAVGMYSSAIPVITIVLAVLFAFGLTGGFENMSHGLYGVAFAAVGMLSTLGITLASDAYGPVADNAGGNAEMSGLDPKVRERTDALDAMGNTTAATGKGFAIGSAALTALALLAAYVAQIRTWLSTLASQTESGLYKIEATKTAMYAGTEVPEAASNLPEGWQVISVVRATITQLLNAFDLSIMNPQLLGGVFIGAMLAFLFCGMTMRAVGRSAGKMVNEVRRQFDKLRQKLMDEGMSEEEASDPDNWPETVEADGEEIPNYAHCVDIATAGALREMVVPSLLAIVVPVVVGIFLGVTGVMGLLAGALTCGFSLACMLNNSGGSWDNAKKWIEKGNLGGKGSDPHKASVVGDTVGDPFKDTSGPSLNILIKLTAMVSVAFAGLIVTLSPIVQSYLGLGGS